MHVHPIKGNRTPAGEAGHRFRLEGKQLPGFTSTVVCAVADGESSADIDDLLGDKKSESGSAQARELILSTLADAGGRMESDQLDAAVAAAAGVSAKTVQNLRGDLKKQGLVRAVPEKDEEGEIRRWFVALTNATANPDPDSSRGNAISRDLDYLSHSRDPHPDIPPPRESGSGTPRAAGEPTLDEALRDERLRAIHVDAYGTVEASGA